MKQPLGWSPPPEQSTLQMTLQTEMGLSRGSASSASEYFAFGRKWTKLSKCVFEVQLAVARGLSQNGHRAELRWNRALRFDTRNPNCLAHRAGRIKAQRRIESSKCVFEMAVGQNWR